MNMLQGLAWEVYLDIYNFAAKGHCSLKMILVIHVNYSAHKLSVLQVNFPALVAASIVAAPSYTSLKGHIYGTII